MTTATTIRRHALISGQVLVVSAVFLQRLAIPGLGISLSLLVVLLVMGRLLWLGVAVPDTGRTRLYLAAMGAAALSATLTGVTRQPASVNSLLLLAVLYAPLCLRIAPEGVAVYPEILRYFTGAMVVVAVAALGQMLAQLAGWHYSDLLGWVPHRLMLDGYNTAYPLRYGSGLTKPNGIFMLEPSFCSQFLAMAVIVQLMLGGRPWRIAVCLAGMLVTISGTGVVLLAAGLVVLALRRGGRWALATLVMTAVALTLLSATPLGKLYRERAGEARQTDSSASLRFSEPYARALSLTQESTSTLLIGHGPGYADRDAAAYGDATGRPLNYPAVAKLLLEYGLPVTLLFAAFVGTLLIRGAPSPTLSACALVLYFALSGSLLQPHTVLLAALVTTWFAAPPAGAYATARAPRGRSPHGGRKRLGGPDAARGWT